MKTEHLVEIVKSWEAIDDAENAIGDFLYGEGVGECDLADVLGNLIDRNAALTAVIEQIAGEPIETIMKRIRSAQLEHLGVQLCNTH